MKETWWMESRTCFQEQTKSFWIWYNLAHGFIWALETASAGEDAWEMPSHLQMFLYCLICFVPAIVFVLPGSGEVGDYDYKAEQFNINSNRIYVKYQVHPAPRSTQWCLLCT